MRLLLDTHVWVWSLLEPSTLSRRAAAALRDSENELWLSAISLWEFIVLVEKRRVTLQEGDLERWLDSALEKAPVNEAPLTHAIVRASRHLDVPQHDPADRFIAATAKVLDLVLLTADERLLNLGGIRTMGAR